MTFIINPGSSYVDNIQYILMYTIGLQSKKARYVLNNTLVLLGYEAKRQVMIPSKKPHILLGISVATLH